jgi:hypothetical protein
MLGAFCFEQGHLAQDGQSQSCSPHTILNKKKPQARLMVFLF